MKIVPESHLDHGLTAAHRAFILERFGARQAFFVETIELPEALSKLWCGLHGPAMGDAPVGNHECTMETREGRAGPSRLCKRPPRLVRTMTVIGGHGPGGDPLVLYTAYGGPVAPREPWDQTGAPPEDRDAAFKFWAEHALSHQSGEELT